MSKSVRHPHHTLFFYQPQLKVSLYLAEPTRSAVPKGQSGSSQRRETVSAPKGQSHEIWQQNFHKILSFLCKASWLFLYDGNSQPQYPADLISRWCSSSVSDRTCPSTPESRMTIRRWYLGRLSLKGGLSSYSLSPAWMWNIMCSII